MAFISNAAKMLLRDLTGNYEDDERIIREHFERVSTYVPRIVPRDGGNEGGFTGPTSTTYVSIAPTAPAGAIGCTVWWQAYTANAVNLKWRSDSTDSGRNVGTTTGTWMSVNFNAYFASAETQTFELAFGGAPGTITDNTVQITGWIF